MKPYLSIVAASRNDNHKGDLDRRSQIFIDALLAQAARHRLETELILVEWNPPADRPSLRAGLAWPADNHWLEIRIITVGRKLHRRFAYSSRLPMFQMIAKNVGVRRARGAFVLQTNIDIVFSDALFSWIARRALRPGVFYRCDRVDVDRNVPMRLSIDAQLDYCAHHVLRVHRKDSTWMVPEGLSPATLSDARAPADNQPQVGALATPPSREERAFAALSRRVMEFERRSDDYLTRKSRIRAKVFEWLRVATYGVAGLQGLSPATLSDARAPADNQPQVGALATPPSREERAFAALSRRVMEFERRSDDYLTRKSRIRAKVFEWLRVATYGVAGLLWITYRLAAFLARKLGVYRLMEKARGSRVLRFALRRVPASRSHLRSLGYKPTYSQLIDDLLAPRHRIPALHTMACGDFLLTDAESWHRMRGTPELPVFSTHLDALAVITAYKVGLKVQDLPSDRVIYHIDHGSGWWTRAARNNVQARKQARCAGHFAWNLCAIRVTPIERFGLFSLVRRLGPF